MTRGKLISNICITGSSGFIGGQLLSYLKDSFNVTTINRSSLNSDIKKLAHQDFIIHCAENSNISSYKKLNTESLAVLEQLVRKCKRLIYLSSSSVYKKNITRPLLEGDQMFERNWYAKNKLMSEKIVLENEGIVLRLCNIYGNNMKQNLITEIISYIEDDSSITLMNPDAKRHFLYIDDLLELIKKIILAPKKGLFNVSNNSVFSAKEIAILLQEIILKESNKKRIIRSGKKEKNILEINSQKVRENYNWYPKNSLECGLKKMLNEKK